MTPAQVAAPVVAVTPVGAYTRLTLESGLLSRALPGQFVAVSPGGPDSALLLRRAFSVHDVDRAAGTVSIVVAEAGLGSRLIAGRRPGEVLDVVGPLGHGFGSPGSADTWIGVGGGYGSAPLAWAAREAAAHGAAVCLLSGAGDASRLCDSAGLVAAAGPDRTWILTEDGSEGLHGRVTDSLGDAVSAAPPRPGGTVRVVACGPMAMLRAVTARALEVAGAAGVGVSVEVAVEEAMACGIGVCMTCVLPVVGADGLTRMTRACTAGPVFDATRVRWDAIGPHGCDVPADAVGAMA